MTTCPAVKLWKIVFAVLVRAHRRGVLDGCVTYLFSDSPNFTPEATILHETLKHSKGGLRSLGRGALGCESASTGKFECITTEEDKRLSSFVSGFLTSVTQPFKQATGSQESSQGLPQVKGVDRCCCRGCRSGVG